MADAAPALRKPRADAARNRELLVEAAKTVFAVKGASSSLDEIAKAAGVGIGTLYRHFPTRDALMEQVYRQETSLLSDSVPRLLAAYEPVEALRQWLLLFIDYFTTKQIIVSALATMPGRTAELFAMSTMLLTNAINTLAARAMESGDIALDVEPVDLIRAIAGVASIGTGPGWEDNARRMVDILLAGLRVPKAQD